MSFLKNIWRTSSKHKKLSEEWSLAKHPHNIDIELCDPADQSQENEQENENNENEDNTFKLKYLGSTLVDRATNESVTAEAIKTILRVAKASGKKLQRVKVTITSKGIKIKDDTAKKENEISIYRISNCSADASNSRVFAFISTNTNGTLECHAFLCSKRKHAQTVTLAVARAFSQAYEVWRTLPTSPSKEKHLKEAQHSEIITPEPALNSLIDLGDFGTEQQGYTVYNDTRPKGFAQNEWVSFDDDDTQRWANNQQIDLILS